MLDRGFNVAVRHIAARLFPTGFDVTPNEAEAPDTLRRLEAHVARTGRMLVWSGASENTIFGCADTNHHFRAWHDWCHLRHGLKFTEQGEEDAAHVQAQHLIDVYGAGHADMHLWLRIIWAEVVGQARIYSHTGQFPHDQEQTTRDLLEMREAHEFASQHIAAGRAKRAA